MACLAIVTRAKRSRREGDHGIPEALSPLVAPSKPAVRTHVVLSGHLPVPLSHDPACSHPHWMRPRRHTEAQHLARRPDVLRQSSGHGGRPRPPALGRAHAVGSAQAGAGVGVHWREVSSNYSTRDTRPADGVRRPHPCTAW